MLVEHPPHLLLQGVVALLAMRPPGGIEALCDMGMIRRWGDRQHLADRLDPMSLTMIINERDHDFDRRSAPPPQNKRSPSQDLVGSSKLAVLALQSLQPLRDIAGNSGASTAIHLSLLDPF